MAADGRAQLTSPPARLHALDLLRGLCIYMMLWQYFAAAQGTFFGVPIDGGLAAAWWLFTPVVTQLFLALACFNLARHDRASFAARYRGKLVAFAVLFVAFSFELFFVEIEDLGQPALQYALEFNAVMCWMLCLALVATVYRFLRPAWWLVLFVASWLLWALPTAAFGDGFERWVSDLIGLPFAYDVRPELFVSSGLLGLLLGHFYYHRPELHRRLWGPLVALGAALWGVWFVWGEPMVIDRRDLYASEYVVIETFVGALGTWGYEVAVILVALWPLRHGHNYRVPFFTWLGVNSLLVYAAHKLLFGRVYLPLIDEVCRRLGVSEVPNTLFWVNLYALSCVGLVYLLKRFLLPKLLVRDV